MGTGVVAPMKSKALSLIVCLCVLFGMSCGSKDDSEPAEKETSSSSKDELGLSGSPAFDGDLVAFAWKGGSIYVSQIDRTLYQQYDVSQRLPMLASITEEKLFLERIRIVESLAENYLLILEAAAKGLAVSPAERDAFAKYIRGQYETAEEYENALAKSNQTEDEVLNVMECMQLANQCGEMQKKAFYEDLTPEKIKAFYEENIDLYTTVHRSAFNQVHIKTKEDRSLKEAEALARKLHSEVKEGMAQQETFKEKRRVIQECAKDHSDGSAAQYNWGYRTVYHDKDEKQGFLKDYLQHVKEAEVGELSDVYPNTDGYAFFFVVEQVPSVVQPFDSPSVQKTIPHLIVEEKMEEWQGGLHEKYQLKIYEEHLANQNYSGPEVPKTTGGEGIVPGP
jgi:hypothetical protein